MTASKTHTLAACLSQVRYCKWYADQETDKATRRHLRQKAREWAKLALAKERDVRAFARMVA
jgi:hypothetical protein